MVWFEGGSPANSGRRYLHADERGSIIDTTDANGNVTNINSYDGIADDREADNTAFPDRRPIPAGSSLAARPGWPN